MHMSTEWHMVPATVHACVPGIMNAWARIWSPIKSFFLGHVHICMYRLMYVHNSTFFCNIYTQGFNALIKMHIKNMWKHSQCLIAASYLQIAIKWDKFNFRRFFPHFCVLKRQLFNRKNKKNHTKIEKANYLETLKHLYLAASWAGKSEKNNNNITTQI